MASIEDVISASKGQPFTSQSSGGNADVQIQNTINAVKGIPFTTPTPTPSVKPTPTSGIDFGGIIKTASDVLGHIVSHTSVLGYNPFIPANPVNQVADKITTEVFKVPGKLTDVVINAVKATPVVNELATKAWDNFYQNALKTPVQVEFEKKYNLDEIAKTANPTQTFGLNMSKNVNEFGKGLIQGILGTTLYGSTNVQNFLDTEIKNTPKQLQNARTIGDLTGTIASYIAPTGILKKIGLVREAVPLVFATLGQTSLPANTPTDQRQAKLIIDATAGAVFQWLEKPANILSLKFAGLKSAELATLTGQIYGDVRALGGTHDQALKATKDALIFNAGLIGAITALGIGKIGLSRALESQIRLGKTEFTPDEARGIVLNNNLENTELGKTIIKASVDAENQAKNLEINMITAEKSKVAALFNAKTPEGIGVGINLVEPSTQVEHLAGKIDSNVPAVVPAENTPQNVFGVQLAPLGKDTTVYRGTLPGETGINVNKANGITGGESTSTDIAVAQSFAKNKGGEVVQYTIPANATMVNHSDLEALAKDYSPTEKTAVVQQFLKDNKVDVVKFDIPQGARGEAEYRIINPDILKTIPPTGTVSNFKIVNNGKSFDVWEGDTRVGQYVFQGQDNKGNNLGVFRLYDQNGKEHILASVDREQVLKDLPGFLQRRGAIVNLPQGKIIETQTVKSTDELLTYIDRQGHRTKAQIAALKADIIKNGIQYPVELIDNGDGTFEINDGTHRIQIAKDLGIKEIPVKIVKTKPVVESGKTPSKIAKSIERKAVEQGLTKGFENIAGFDKITIEEQAKLATDLINNDFEKAKRVIRGEEPLPKGLRGTALITATEEYIRKTGDAELAFDLANSPLVSETSLSAQELRLAAERQPDSLALKLRELKKIREATIKKKTGKTAKIAIEDEVKKIKNGIKKSGKEDWASFIRSIQC